ncbi:pyridoxal phosphate-dependent aminotransferase [Lachnospiraceae bacterium NSJ-143]|nr:pyridoxal phosphate-dependent aminotransferase [Lachnospiraceae bacterium NSJ-143]
MELSRRIMSIKPSATLAVTAKAKELKAAGKDVVAFAAGEPDFDTPENIRQAGIEAINAGFTRYTAAPGIIELRKAICQKLKNDNGLEYDPSQIIVCNGAKHALANSFMAILNEGDEVIIPAPFWVSYSAMVEIAGGKPVIVYTKAENNFMLSRKDLEAVYTDKTKAIVLTSPSNPTGMIASRENLQEIADFAVERDILVIADEIYEKLIYNKNKKHISIGSLNKEIFDRTITINGVSKSYAMTGWRIGYVAAPPAVAKCINTIQSHMASNANSIAQMAALEAISGPQDSVEEMRQQFEKRCDYIFEREEEIPFIKALKPEGAFYLFVDISGTCGKKYNGAEIKNAADFASVLLENKLTAVVPCADFGMENYIRLSYAISLDDIKKGMDRIAEFISELE